MGGVIAVGYFNLNSIYDRHMMRFLSVSRDIFSDHVKQISIHIACTVTQWDFSPKLFAVE